MTEQHNTTFPMPGVATPNTALSLLGRRASNTATIPSAASLPENIFTNPAFQPTSVINLSNSSDVVIGPMTQYQGPVTIYQYMDATVESRAMHANGGIRQTNSTENPTTLLQKLSTNSTLLIVLIFIIIISVGVAVYLAIGREDKNKSRDILFGNDYETGTFPNLGKGHLVVDRIQWGATERHNLTMPLNHPIPYVLLTHVGVQSLPCENIYKCSIKMRTFQDSAIAEQGLPEINSNFYVGNDGNIYVGRGWDYANTYGNKSLAVTFMGDFNRYKPSNKSLEAVQYLLSHAMSNKYIALDYKLIAHNQTKTTKSPGINVIKEIVTWPHWYPCGRPGNPVCGAEIGLPEVWDAKQ